MGNLCDCCGVRDKERIGLPEYGSGGNSQYGFALAKNDRARMEDAVAMEENVAGHKCLAVFDGHGGDKAARRAQELLPKQLDLHLQQSSTKEEAVMNAFHAVEMLMQPELAEEAKVMSSGASSGTVTCVALLQEKELLLINLGDCRGVVCESAKVTITTTDHSPEKETEKQRLAETGVTVEGGYIDGKVQVSRAFGDILDKTGQKIPGLISQPELTAIEVKDNTEFVILASDGIWDGIQSQTAATTARKVLRETRSPEEAAKAVVEAAAKATKADNAAVIVLALNVPDPVPKRDEAQSRFRPSSKTELGPEELHVHAVDVSQVSSCCSKRHRHNRI